MDTEAAYHRHTCVTWKQTVEPSLMSEHYLFEARCDMKYSVYCKVHITRVCIYLKCIFFAYLQVTFRQSTNPISPTRFRFSNTTTSV